MTALVFELAFCLQVCSFSVLTVENSFIYHSQIIPYIMNCLCKYTLGTSGQLELRFQLPRTCILSTHETQFLRPFPSAPFLQGEGETVNIEDFAYNSAMEYLVL